MLKILQMTFAVGTLLFVIVDMVNAKVDFQTPMILFLGLTLLIMGVRVFQQKQKLIGGILMGASLFSILVSIQGFVFN
ncbi:hypothetical protein [Mesobacillus maritimus]|nr:hypothetical protein [Mesobacillus maritimus]